MKASGEGVVVGGPGGAAAVLDSALARSSARPRGVRSHAPGREGPAGARQWPVPNGGLAMKTLREIMRAGFLFVVQRGATVREAVQVMTASNVGIVLVLEGERLVGVFSERDVVRRVVNCGLDPDRTPVGDVMTSQIVVGDPDEDYQSAMRKMDQANIRHLLVVKDAQMLSMISIRDLIRVDMQDKGEEIRYLREYLYQVPPEPARPTAHS
jgi:CBS domain-containing protein